MGSKNTLETLDVSKRSKSKKEGPTNGRPQEVVGRI
jgi:hypothetical protein